jgi:peptide/nickel transport system substrate-binding protein
MPECQPEEYADVLSRRQFVTLTTATGAAALAGCSGSQDEQDETTTEGGDSMDDTETDDGGDSAGYPDQVDRWFVGTQTDFPASNYHWNLLAGWEIPHDQFGLFAQWTQYLVDDDEFHPHLVEDWEHGDGEMTLTLSDEFTWGSGSPVTAEDLVFQLDVFEAADQTVWQFIDRAEATGESELTVTYPEGTNPDLVEYSLLGNMAAYSPEDFEGENWEEDPAGVEISNPDPSGPLALTDHNDTYSQTEPRDGLDDFADHHLASHYNWNGYQIEFRDGNNAAHNSFINDEVDGQHSLFAPPDVLQEFPDSVREFRVPGGFGMAVWFDHDVEPWNQREVRQAVYHSIDRESVIRSVGESTKIHHPAPTGLTWASVEEWFDSTEPDGFTSYSYDPDQAQSLLEEAGYSMGDVDVQLTYPQTWSDWATAAQTIVDHLNEAGWNASGDARSEGPGSYAGSGPEVFVDQHTEGGAPRMNHPYFSLDYILRNRLRDTESHFANYPTEVEIDGETIDLEGELQTLATTTDEAQQREIVDRLARVVNREVPCIVVMEKYEQSFVNENRFDIPDEETPHFYTFWPMWWLPKLDESLDGADAPGLLKATDN